MTVKTATALALAALLLAAPATASEMVKAAQQALKDKGLDPGSVDGKLGPKTEAALRDFQKAHGIEPTGRLDAQTVRALGMDGRSAARNAGAAASARSASR